MKRAAYSAVVKPLATTFPSPTEARAPGFAGALRQGKSRRREAGCVLFAVLALAFASGPGRSDAALTNRYVDKASATPSEPYDAWANAAADIQTAIDYAYAGETVLVAAATYDTGGITNWPAGTVLTNRVVINKAITVRSEPNNPTNTIIKGAGPNGLSAVRCVYMADGSALIGFTLTNGATLASGIANDTYAGGVYCTSTVTVISNCIITSNSAVRYAGAYYGTLFNCTLIRNYSDQYGGGGYASSLSNCTLIGNSTGWGGGGFYGGSLYNCTLVSNIVRAGNGGGVSACHLYNCTLIGNSALASAAAGLGGAFYSSSASHAHKLYNCLLIGNKANYGGGAWQGTLYNCTVVGNYADYYGGGTASNKLYNSIVYFNDAPTGPNWYDDFTTTTFFTNSCTTPMPGVGAGNITSDPMLLNKGSNYGTNHLAGNYRLSPNSPCINTGTNGSWTALYPDLDGRTRIRYGTIDMGAYEKLYEGTIFSFH